ncbi:Tn3 family transposase [Antrihabitans spumae]|uniref:Tn3 family transposase n=1 Tax=Antrihabitans spumae TaxID=3373370 RepID=A0ABW7KNU5_9NOCA
MATRTYSDAELEQLRGFPDSIGPDELIRYFTLTAGDVAFVNSHRTPPNRIGVAVQLCSLPWLGFVPDRVDRVPDAGARRLAERLGIPVAALAEYGGREQTRTDHLREVAEFLGWRSAGDLDFKELDQFLLARAIEHDSPGLLFRLASEHLRSSRVIRPGPVWLTERVAAARQAAQIETYTRLEHLLTPRRRSGLDGLLDVDTELGSTRLHWLSNGATTASPEAIKSEIAKLRFLRDLGVDHLDVSVLPVERRRYLAGIGRRSTAQMLSRRDPERRYPILLTLIAQSGVEVLDEVVQLFDQAVSGRESHARNKLADRLAERAVAAEDRLALLDAMLPVLLDSTVPDAEVGTILRGLGMQRMRAAHSGAPTRLPRDRGHLAVLDDSFSYLRRFVPDVLDAIDFRGTDAAADLITATAQLRGLYVAGARNVPPNAPVSFVPARWRGYLDDAVAAQDATAYRHYWELCVLYGLRDGLRSGDVFVPGSRRYADPTSYLISGDQWQLQRQEYCRLVGKTPDGRDAIEHARHELRDAVAALEEVLAAGDGAVRLDDKGELVIGPLTAETVPDEADALRDDLVAMLPRIPLASLLIEVDRRTGFTDLLVHAGGKQARSPELKRNLIACLIGFATNMGLTAMAHASGISYDVLAWTSEWYLREPTLRAGNAVIVDYHHGLPMSQRFGSGTLSSSDGQRFPMRGKSLTARHLSRYFVDEGISTYTHVSDQHSTYGTKIIVATDREAHYVLDEILGNATDLPITEHAVDTGGVTLVNFALFDLVGLTLSPRIRNLGRIVPYRLGPRRDYLADYPHAGPLLTAIAGDELIVAEWDNMLRLAASFKYGHTTPSLLVGKLSASSRQNRLAAALKEWGAIRRTIFACRYLSDETYRRKIGRQLNKGESMHALRRDLHFAGLGKMTRHHHEQQTEQAWCLTVVTNAIICWMTEYLGLAVDARGAAGQPIDDAVLAHISPAHSEPVHFFGSIPIDVDKELAQLDATGYRPLRNLDT